MPERESFPGAAEWRMPEETSASSTSSPENREGESLRENDLIVADSDLPQAKQLLREASIPSSERPWTPAEAVNEDSWVPGEFVVSILASEGSDQPADTEMTQRSFALLKEHNIPVRYGKMLGQGQS